MIKTLYICSLFLPTGDTVAILSSWTQLSNESTVGEQSSIIVKLFTFEMAAPQTKGLNKTGS